MGTWPRSCAWWTPRDSFHKDQSQSQLISLFPGHRSTFLYVHTTRGWQDQKLHRENRKRANKSRDLLQSKRGSVKLRGKWGEEKQIAKEKNTWERKAESEREYPENINTPKNILWLSYETGFLYSIWAPSPTLCLHSHVTMGQTQFCDCFWLFVCMK